MIIIIITCLLIELSFIHLLQLSLCMQYMYAEEKSSKSTNENTPIMNS